MRVNYTQTRESLLHGSRLAADILPIIALGGFGFLALMVVAQLGGYPFPDINLGSNPLFLIPLASAAFGLVLGVVYWFILIPLGSSTLHRRNPHLSGQMEMEVHDHGITIKSPRETSHLAWLDIRGFKENRHVFHLCPHKTAGHTIPKADLSPEEVVNLRTALSDHLRVLR